MTVSIGIAEARPAAQADGKAAADELLAEAEMAMHRAKLGGGDDFEVSST
jgi:GGDEF domain-containing protein